jgi:regulatory protein
MPPNPERLYEAAVAHLARYAATEAGLRRVLARRVDRWARRAAETERAEAANVETSDTIEAVAAAAKAAIPGIIARLRAGGALDDNRFAESRAARLTRGGKSRRATLAHLAAKGIAPAMAQTAIAVDAQRELAAACAFLRRRRLGPFGSAEPLQSLGALARAGFPQAIARTALGLDPEEAEGLIKTLD